MSRDDAVYTAILIGSVFGGKLLSLIRDPCHRKYFCGAVGASVVISVCGVSGLHSLVSSLISGLVVTKINARICHLVSFVWNFGYLGFFRTAEYFGLPAISPHDNVVQLFVTLRSVGLAFEVHDSASNHERLKKEGLIDEENSEALRLKCEYQNVNPSLLDSLLYSYSFIGLFTGPYYKFLTYQDMLFNRFSNRDVHRKQWSSLKEKLRPLPLYLIVHLILTRFVSVQNAKSEEFSATEPLWFRVFYIVPLFMNFRFRLYIAFTLSECACITAGLGAYPISAKSKPGQGPTNHSSLRNWEFSNENVDFETVANLDAWECEFSPTMRGTIKSWNKTIQFWMAANVYHRLTGLNLYYRTAVTMAISAFWHGVHPGYYLTFLSVPLYLAAEDLLRALQGQRKEGTSGISGVWRWVSWFVRVRSCEYMGIGFLFLGFQETIHYWKGLCFYGHVFIAVAIVCGVLLRSLRCRRK